MTNHIHLVVQVEGIPLSRIMQNLSFRYTRWINWRYHRCGHLFQGRYKSVLVDADSYLLELVRYVHLNPVRAEMAVSAEGYPWTGHKAYCGKETIPWLCTDLTLGMLSQKRDAAIRAYLSFVDDGIGEGRRGELHGEGTADNRIIGDEEFVQNLIGEGKELPGNISVDDVISAVCRRYATNRETLALPGKGRELSHARGMAAWIVQDIQSCSLKELGKRIGRDLSSLSAAAQRLHKRSVAEASLLREKSDLLTQITKCKA